MLAVALVGTAVGVARTREQGQITISTSQDEEKVYVRIRDTGPGIPQEQLEHIFDFHFRARDSRVKVGLGLVAAMAVVAPIYVIQVWLVLLLPHYIAVDPVPLFLFALVLGTLYYRTHRIVPAVVLHMALNLTSLVVAWLLLVK